MGSLLHLDSGAHLSDESISRRLTACFARTWRRFNRGEDLCRRDLVVDPVPPLDHAYCALGRRAERLGLRQLSKIAPLARTSAERHTWQVTEPLIRQLLSADTVLIGAPMYNYGVPAALKAWIDRVAFPGALLDRDGASLLADTRVVMITPRGGEYRPGTPRARFDFVTDYLRAFFGRCGVNEANITVVDVEVTLADLVPHLWRFRPRAERSLAAAETRIRDLAAVLARSTPDPNPVGHRK